MRSASVRVPSHPTAKVVFFFHEGLGSTSHFLYAAAIERQRRHVLLWPETRSPMAPITEAHGRSRSRKKISPRSPIGFHVAHTVVDGNPRRDGQAHTHPPSACAATSAAASAAACAAACAAPAAGSSSSSTVDRWSSPHCNEDAGVGTDQPDGSRTLPSAAGVDEGDETSRIPPAEAVAAAGPRKTCRAPRPPTASCRELPPARGYCVPARRRKKPSGCTASPDGRRDAGWSRDHPARRFGSAEHQASGLRRCVGPERRDDERLRHQPKLVDGRDPIGLRGLRL